MRFVLLSEGDLERKALPKFLKRWLDPRLKQPVRIDADQIQGVGELIHSAPRRAKKHLNDPRQDVIAVIGLFDLHEAALDFPQDKNITADRVEWARSSMEAAVAHPKFRQFLAVHETEAWLLSDWTNFPTQIGKELRKQSDQPETVNHNEPPGDLIKRLYRTKLKRRYSKPVDGYELFEKLDPELAYQKCPNLKAMLDEMLRLAQEAGL